MYYEVQQGRPAFLKLFRWHFRCGGRSHNRVAHDNFFSQFYVLKLLDRCIFDKIGAVLAGELFIK